MQGTLEDRIKNLEDIIAHLRLEIANLNARISKQEIDHTPYGPVPGITPRYPLEPFNPWVPGPKYPEIPEPWVPPSFPPQFPKPRFTKGCSVCGIGADGEVLGYVCVRKDCPSGVVWCESKNGDIT